jgi:glycosyltransferase involved in cell wall biosynthesis
LHLIELMKNQKTILIFSTAYLPLIGGAELAVKEITDRLLDYNFCLVTARIQRNLPKQEKVGQIEVFRLGIGSPLDKLMLAFLGGFWASKKLKKRKISVVWGLMASFGGLAALSYRRLTETPFLLTLQEGDDLIEVEKKARILGRRFGAMFREADFIQAISTYLKNWAMKMGATCPIEVVPNGTGQIENRRLKKENKVDGEVEIITTSRLVKKNGVDDLIKSLQFLPDNFRLKIVGTGPDESKLKVLVDELGLGKRIEFVGLVTPNKIFDYLIGADIFVRPSLSEGLGNSFLEAMAVGLPVIGTPVGGIPDFLKENVTGWFCELRKPESIAEKIKFIVDCNNRKLVARVIDNAQRLVKEKYNWDEIANQMKEILKKLAA